MSYFEVIIEVVPREGGSQKLIRGNKSFALTFEKQKEIGTRTSRFGIPLYQLAVYRVVFSLALGVS